MSKDKKNKATKKRRKWLDILRWVLIVVLLVVGLALIFNKSIRNTVIAWNTNKYQVSKVSKKTIEKNKEAGLKLIEEASALDGTIAETIQVPDKLVSSLIGISIGVGVIALTFCIFSFISHRKK